MNNNESIKQSVKEKYAEIALQSKAENASSCCGAGGCSSEVYNIMTDSYDGLHGYAEEADLGLGCGLPTEFANIRPGDTVIDLGSGAGNDCFVARAETGETGRVIGIDFTPEMIEKAKANAEKLGYKNVSFRLGDIEQLPLAASTADVVISNCVLNLVPDKKKAFSEIMRVLRPGGHFCVSDIVLLGELPENIRTAAEMYTGCVSGAMQKEDYLQLIHEAGFANIALRKVKTIFIPDDILERYLNREEIKAFRDSGTGILSVTVNGEKVLGCCGGGCC